jgi:glycosyltransferase involved in cell wall biosynthesis
MKFSVVIPDYNESENIVKAIKALSVQTVARSDLEIIVVDNNSTDNSAAAAAAAGADLVIEEKKQGTNMARQAGLARAQGETIAFLDADNLPPPEWLEKIAADLADKRFAAVSGPYDFGFSGLKKILSTIYLNLFMANSPRLLKLLFRRKSGIIIGGNFAARREVFTAIGGIPPLAFWGDDAAIAMLISRRVGPVLFDPKLIVKSSPRRFERSGFFKLPWNYLRAYFKIFFSDEFNP